MSRRQRDPDEENLLGDGAEDAARHPRAAAATKTSSPTSAAPAISAFDAMAAANNNRNPILLAKLVARKFLLLVTTEEEEDPSSRFGMFVGLFKDIILGIVFGLITISLITVLDHRNIIHLQSAHHLRDAAYIAINDPDTLAAIEAETEMKFMSVTEYENTKREIEENSSELESLQKQLEERTKEVEEKNKELETLRAEFDKLNNDPKVGGLLGKNFCGKCQWQGSIRCDARVDYLVSHYNVSKFTAQMNLVKEGKCKSQ